VPELSHDAGDDGFHEIQLSGKQLVFLFMATTVVSVVIFLCGVLVGRGVRGETVNAADTTALAPASGSGPVAQSTPAPPPPAEPPAAAAEAPLSYPKRLESDKPPPEELKPPVEAKKPQDTSPPPPLVPASPAASPTPASASSGARPGTWVVQIVALTDRAAATAVVDRLAAKGYPAFLVSPRPGAPVQNFKVQVGRYDDRHEAEQIKARLKKEEQFEPWILR